MRALVKLDAPCMYSTVLVLKYMLAARPNIATYRPNASVSALPLFIT